MINTCHDAVRVLWGFSIAGYFIADKSVYEGQIASNVALCLAAIFLLIDFIIVRRKKKNGHTKRNGRNRKGS